MDTNKEKLSNKNCQNKKIKTKNTNKTNNKTEKIYKTRKYPTNKSGKKTTKTKHLYITSNDTFTT